MIVGGIAFTDDCDIVYYLEQNAHITFLLFDKENIKNYYPPYYAFYYDSNLDEDVIINEVLSLFRIAPIISICFTVEIYSNNVLFKFYRSDSNVIMFKDDINILTSVNNDIVEEEYYDDIDIYGYITILDSDRNSFYEVLDTNPVLIRYGYFNSDMLKNYISIDDKTIIPFAFVSKGYFEDAEAVFLKSFYTLAVKQVDYAMLREYSAIIYLSYSDYIVIMKIQYDIESKEFKTNVIFSLIGTSTILSYP